MLFSHILINCLGKHQLTASSCLMHSIVASRALVPRVASSSTAFTVFSSDVTLVTITLGMTWDMLKHLPHIHLDRLLSEHNFYPMLV